MKSWKRLYYNQVVVSQIDNNRDHRKTSVAEKGFSCGMGFVLNAQLNGVSCLSETLIKVLLVI